MALKEELVRQGNFLFRWRSYSPLIIIPVLFSAYISSEMQGEHEAWETIAVIISFSGLALGAFITGHTPKATSGRNTRKQLAKKLNTTGMYSLVRHPLYLANFLIFLGIVLFIAS